MSEELESDGWRPYNEMRVEIAGSIYPPEDLIRITNYALLSIEFFAVGISRYQLNATADGNSLFGDYWWRSFFLSPPLRVYINTSSFD